MKRLLIGFALTISALCLSDCKKEVIGTDDLIYALSVSPNEVQADGTSMVTVTCVINPDATSSNREVVLKCSTGTFSENNQQTITKKAEYQADKLVIQTKITAPMQPGILEVTAKPNLPEVRKDYIKTQTAIVSNSTPVSIKTTANAFYIWTNDNKSEVIITGTLINATGKKVSTGNKVLVEDYYSYLVPAGGRFRDTNLVSNADSKVSAIYTSANLIPNQSIYIKFTLLDANSRKTSIKDSVLITAK